MAAKCKYCKGSGQRANYWDDKVGACGFCDGSGERKPTEAAQAAALLRADLKKAFPDTKFSVKSRNFAGGDAVDVSWDDGPPVSAVKEILWKYEAGSFDGQVDLYTYGPKKDWPTAKYVQSQRSMSVEVANFIVPLVNNRYGAELKVVPTDYGFKLEGEKFSPNMQCWETQLVYREFQEMEF